MSPKSEAGFFRDAAALKRLKRVVQRRFLTVLTPGRPLRVWVPRCASGEDAYSVAICLIESFGSLWREIPLCVFSTGSDENSLFRARAGRYAADAARRISSDRLKRFFIQESNGISVRPFVRDTCRFVRHNRDQDALLSRLDLIVCRETLASMPPPERADTLQFLHSALAPDGVLLDRTGTAADSPELFAPILAGRSYVARKVSARFLPPASGLFGRNTLGMDARSRESEAKLRILLSSMEAAVLMNDAETGLILEANEAAQNLFGLRLSEFLRIRVKDLYVDPENVRRPKAERRSEERLRLPHCRRKDGTFFPVDDSKTFVMVKGRPCNLWLLKDATQRLRIKSSLKREEERDVFVGEVVHELRSPLAVIQGSVEILRQGARKTKARSQFLQFIEKHASRMASLVDRLLDLSATNSVRRSTQPSPVLLSETILEIVSTFNMAAKRRAIAIKIDIPKDLAVLADPADLPHVFGNLLDNAIKFTPRGGNVIICGRSEGVEGIFSIRDTGGGVAPEDLERIFERFYRSERTRRTKGTGLGLAIVHQIVKANHGRVVAENDPAGGAVFHVAFPLAPTEGCSPDTRQDRHKADRLG